MKKWIKKEKNVSSEYFGNQSQMNVLHYSGYQDSNSRKNSGSSTNLFLIQKNQKKRGSVKDDSREVVAKKKENKRDNSMIEDPMLDYSKSEEEELKEV